MIYPLFFTQAGYPRDLLIPTIITYLKVSDGTDVTPVPAIEELGGGFYTFTASPDEAILAVIDGGSVLTNYFERFKVQQVAPNDGNLDAAVSTRAPESGGNVAAILAKTDNLPADPASNTQVNTRLEASGYTAPDNAGIADIQDSLTALFELLPEDPASQAVVLAAVAALQVVLVGMQARVLAQNQPYPVTLDGGTGTKVSYKYGEARHLTLEVKDALGNAVDLSGAALLLGVKKDKGDAAYTFSKLDAAFNKTQAALGIVSVYISATDTSQLAATYVGELKCTWAGAEEIVEKTGDLAIEIKKAVT